MFNSVLPSLQAPCLLPSVWHEFPGPHHTPLDLLVSLCFARRAYWLLPSTAAHPIPLSFKYLQSICCEPCSDDIRREAKDTEATSCHHCSVTSMGSQSFLLWISLPSSSPPWVSSRVSTTYRTLLCLHFSIPVAPTCWPPLPVPHSLLTPDWYISKFSDCECMIF